MECLTAKSKIQETFKEVSELYTQKNIKAINEQEAVNRFLDKILAFQKRLQERTDNINVINSKFQELSWLHDMDQECLDLMKEILVKSKDVHKKLIKFYVSLSTLIRKGIAKEAIHNFKLALDDLNEFTQDLEDLFFNLPDDKEFTERVKKLSK